MRKDYLSRTSRRVSILRRAAGYAIEQLETRRLLSTINWVNRGDGSDSFDTVFGANDDLARAVVDAALDAWERVITDFQQGVLVLLPVPHLENPNTIDITLSMDPNDLGFGGGAGAATHDFIGHPIARDISIDSGNNVDADPQGDGAGWFLDPTPNDHSEFTGNIQNPFVGDAPASSPANGLSDLYSIVTIEMNHALGLTNIGSPDWTGNPFISNTGVADSISTPGTLWTFSGGPSGVQGLLTSNNGGAGGTDTGAPLHVALPGQANPGIPAGFVGALDVGNASYSGSRRYLPSLLSSLMLQDVYGYTLAAGGADVFGTMHAIFNSTTGNVLVRGMTGSSNSNDIINISRSGGQLVVSVDVGADVAGTGPTGPLESRFNVASVSSLTLNGLDGNDTINFSGDLSFLTGGIQITGDGGTDTLTIDYGSGNPVPAAGLTFDGGSEAGTDLLVLQNGAFASETHNATGPSSGNITFSSGGTVTYTGLEPVDDTVAVTNYTFSAPATADIIQIENSPVPGRSRIRSANGTFELQDYANKTNVTVDGAGGGDTLNLTATVIPPGMATLTVNGGASGDTFNITTTLLVPTVLNGDDGADVFNVNNSAAGSTLTANGGNNNDVVFVNGTGAGSTVVVNGDAGSDTLVVNDTGLGSTLTVNGNDDPDAININGNSSGVVVNGGDGDDTVDVSGTGAGTSLSVNGNNDDDRINVVGAGLGAGSTLLLHGNNDDDTFDVTSSPNIVIPVDGDAGNDTLKVNGQTLLYDFTTIAGTSIFSTAGLQDVTSVEVELLDVRNGTFTVVNTVVPNVRVQGVEDGPATLDGIGVILGTLTADSGGSVSPAIGAGVSGILGAGGTTLNAGSTYFVDLNGLINGVEHDLLNVTGTVAINNGDLTGTLGYGSIPGDELLIIRNDGFDPVVGTFAQGSLVTIGGQKFAIDYAYDGDGDGAFNDVALIRYGAALAPDPCEPSKQALYVSATTGDDLIFFNKLKDDFVRVVINGVIEGTFKFTGRILAFGQSGNDLISVEEGIKKSAWLWGHVGRDTLIQGGSGEENIMIGGVGDDRLLGAKKKGIYVGGAGADFMQGGDGEDIMITGSTVYDNNTPANRAAWCAIQDEWLHGAGGYAGHVSHLTTGGGLNGTNVLNVTTVFNDGVVDTAEGGKGKDWFIAHTSGGGPFDVLTDRSAKDEQVQVI